MLFIRARSFVHFILYLYIFRILYFFWPLAFYLQLVVKAGERGVERRKGEIKDVVNFFRCPMCYFIFRISSPEWNSVRCLKGKL